MPAAPSLLIVPYRSKTGRLYSQIPIPVAPATTGAGDFTVTRDTTARRFNSAGLIESVASGIPRLDYYTSGGTAGCPALLVEPAGTNLALQSENFGTTWSNTDLVITSGFTSPSNNSNGTLIEASANTGRLRQAFAAITSGTTHTFSLFAEAGNLALASGVSLVFQEGASTNFASGVVQSFRLDTGTVGASGTVGAGFTLTRASIENYGNGWYRCSMTVTVSYTPTAANISIRPTSTITSNLPVTVSGGTAYIWGAQLETGSVATSYIPTTTAAVTRNADVVLVSGAVSGSIGQTAGTIYCEFAFLGTPTTRSGPIFLRQADSRGMSINFAPTDSPSGIRFSSRNNAGTTSLNIVSGALQVGTFYKVAIAYDAAGTAAGGTQASGVVAYVNGSQVAIGTFQVPDAAGLTQFRMYGANSGSDTEAFNGRIRSAALYTTRLTDDELDTLTTP